MKKLKICLISLTVSPDSADGEAKVIRALFEYLKQQGHDVTLITGKWNKELRDPNIIQFNLIRKRFFWVLHFYYKVFKFLRTNSFDITHANSAKAALPIILARRTKFICTIHDFTPFETELTTIPIERLLIRFVSKRASIIITVSNFVKREFQHYIPRIDNNKIATIYNGIEEKYKPYPVEAQRLKEKLNIQGPVLLYIGRITPYKGVANIIEAYRIVKTEIPNVNLVIGGKPDYLMENEYKNWREMHKDVLFTGYLPEDEVPYYFSMGDIFLTYSSSSEGFGLTPLEAISCGTPVICSSILVYREILRDNALFVPPRDSLKLAEKIKILLNDDDLRNNLVKNAQTFIKKYSWNTVGKRLEKEYLRLLNYQD
ncbi:MAG: glycosyltransferase family 4 protein [Candidatus Lokiarchaeota archaeon]|nr:glycosyltransferase family 4 protein [Candidatus Lokiarchaeota archaeon]